MWTVAYLCSFFGISNLEELVLEQDPSFLRFSAALCTFPIPQHVAAAQGNAETRYLLPGPVSQRLADVAPQD